MDDRDQLLRGISLGALVRAALDKRHLRANYLPAEILEENGCDVLLALAGLTIIVEVVTPERVSVMAGVPPSSTCRWLRRLCELRFVEVEEDISAVRLSQHGSAAVQKALASSS